MAEAEEGEITENEITDEDDEDQEETLEELQDYNEGMLEDEEEILESSQEQQPIKSSEGILDSGTLEKGLPDTETLQGRIDERTLKKLEEIESQAKETANLIYELKTKIKILLEKEKMTEEEARELEQINAELRAQLLLFDEKTKEIQDIITNSNILDGIPSRLPKVAYSEDVLPRVILCGFEDDYVPKIVVCDQKMKDKDRNKDKCLPTCPGQSKVPSFTRRICEEYDIKNNSAPEKSELQKVTCKLEEEICNKDRLLSQLQLKLAGLQNEICMVSTENAILNERIRKVQQSQARQPSCQPKKMCPGAVAAKLQEYSIYTRKLENQLAEMERDFTVVHKEICAAQKERQRLGEKADIMGISSSCRKR